MTAPAAPSVRAAAPATRFARAADGHALAFQTLGDDGPALVLVPGFASHLDALWEPPGPAAFLRRLATRARIVVYDRRGQGRSPGGPPPTVEQDVADLGAVLDAAGIDRAIVVGQSQGGAAAIAFAASAPGRAAGLVVVGGYARAAAGDGYPHGPARDDLVAFARVVAERWGDPVFGAAFAPSAAGDERFARWWSRSTRMALTSDDARASLVRRAGLDVRDAVRGVHCPALVVHRTGDRITPIEHGRWLARHLPDARLLELPGEDHLWWLPDPHELADPILDFALGSHAP